MDETALNHCNTFTFFPWEVYAKNFSSIKQLFLDDDYKIAKINQHKDKDDVETATQINRVKIGFFSKLVECLTQMGTRSQQNPELMEKLQDLRTCVKTETYVSQLFFLFKKP